MPDDRDVFEVLADGLSQQERARTTHLIRENSQQELRRLRREEPPDDDAAAGTGPDSA